MSLTIFNIEFIRGHKFLFLLTISDTIQHELEQNADESGGYIEFHDFLSEAYNRLCIQTHFMKKFSHPKSVNDITYCRINFIKIDIECAM